MLLNLNPGLQFIWVSALFVLNFNVSDLFEPFLVLYLRFWFPGGYDMEEKAARAYDLAALKYWGPSTHINFPVMISSSSLHFLYPCMI